MALSKALGLGRRKAVTLTLFSLVALLFCGGLGVIVRSASATEYQVKAVFLFNFAQFVEWPTEAFPDRDAPLIIGVLGQDPFGSYLDETVRGERVNSRQLVVQRYRRVEDVKNCHLLFISRSEGDHLEQIVNSLRYRRILTVSDADISAKSGVIIRFVTEQNKIKLRISIAAARAANLTISSKLLRLAEIVAPGKD